MRISVPSGEKVYWAVASGNVSNPARASGVTVTRPLPSALATIRRPSAPVSRSKTMWVPSLEKTGRTSQLVSATMVASLPVTGSAV